MDLERLNKALATYEVAEHIFKVDNGKTLAEALAMLEAANAEKENDDEDSENDDDNLSLKSALKHRGAPTGPSSPIRNKAIVLGKNKSKVTFNGIAKKNSTKAFDAVSSAITSTRNKMKSEGELLPWMTTTQRRQVVHAVKKKTLSKDALREVKDRVLKAIADKVANKEAQAIVNPRAQYILSKKLHEGALSVLTKAQASITTHPSAAVGSPKQPVRDQDDKPAFRLPEFDVKACIPPEFRRKIEPSVDMSFGAKAARTKAAATLNRPKPEFRETANHDQGSISANQPSAKIPNIEPPIEDGKSMAASTFKTHPNSQKQQFPRVLPSDTGDAIEDGRGYYR